jgi:hypothetical protein
MSTDKDTNNPKTDTTETDSNDMTWDKKMEAHKSEEEQQKKHGSENDTDTDIDEVVYEQQVEDNQDEEQEQEDETNVDEDQDQEDEVNVDEDQEQACRTVWPNDSEGDSKKKGSHLGEKKKPFPAAKKMKEKTPAIKGGRSYTEMNTNDHTWTSKFVKLQEYTLENDGNGIKMVTWLYGALIILNRMTYPSRSRSVHLGTPRL